MNMDVRGNKYLGCVFMALPVVSVVNGEPQKTVSIGAPVSMMPLDHPYLVSTSVPRLNHKEVSVKPSNEEEDSDRAAREQTTHFSDDRKIKPSSSKGTRLPRTIAEYPRTKSIDFNLDTLAGYLKNYNTYPIESPVVATKMSAKIRFQMMKKVDLKVNYKFAGFATSEPVVGSDLILQETTNKLKITPSWKYGMVTVRAKGSWQWTKKNRWPDQYQPDPQDYAATRDIADITLGSTDRYSHYTAKQKISIKVGRSSKLSVKTSYENSNKIGVTDPNYSLDYPLHIPPSLEKRKKYAVDFKYLNSSKPWDLNNIRLGYKRMSNMKLAELSKDRQTGKTHYRSNPNPSYAERRDSMEISALLSLWLTSVALSPFAAYEVAEDLYQGYYSSKIYVYGCDFEYLSKITHREFSLGVRINREQFSENGYRNTSNHVFLTDGDTLFKHYLDVKFAAKIPLSKSASVILVGSWTDKNTNLPSYVPGENPLPGTKNYRIDFSFTNTSAQIGLRYQL